MKITVKDSDELMRLIIMSGNSIRSFSKQISMGNGHLSQIINGKRHPNPQTARKVSDGLNKEFEELFFIQSGNKCVQENKTA